ncbi:MAG: cyclic nucleotide-binding domain-containing protein [Lachnospiraceae bacterium]|nr:cyclic nucleotide-binding domain-containing protein [Lachnospiraceae bacterium]
MEYKGKIFRVSQGTVILKEEETKKEMYKLLDGHAEVYLGYGTEKETLLGIIGPQACFGEMGALLGSPSLHTVVAYSDCLVMCITQSEMVDFIRHDGKAVLKIMQSMAQTMTLLNLNIGMLMDDLKNGKKPDENRVHEMEKTASEFAVYRNSAMSGKFWTADNVAKRRGR